MKLTLIEKKPEFSLTSSSDVISFIFKPEQPVQWIAGQYFQYKIADQNPDNRGNQRYFTSANAPFEQNLMVTTRFAKEKGSSFKNFLHSMEVGQIIEATGPYGEFTLENPTAEYILIAGGIGITPYRAVLQNLDHNNKPMPITLLYANRDQNIVYKQVFDDLATKHLDFKVDYVIGPVKIDESYVEQNIPNFVQKTFYISGPEPMVGGIKQQLLELGIPEEQVKIDYFPGYTN